VSAPAGTEIDRALSQPSLTAAFMTKAERDPQGVALRMFGSADQLTWGEWQARSLAVAGALHDLGVRPGDRVALLLGTRMDFHVLDLGALMVGAIPFSLYVTAAAVQMQEILENAQPQVLITEAAFAAKARSLTGVAHVIVLEEDGEPSAPGFEDVAPAGPQDICTLVYTSGTTGPPKGVMFRHGAMMACLDSIRRRFPTTERERAIAYLPMAHIAERIYGHYAAFLYGYEVTSLADPAALGQALRAVRPTRFFGVPRIYEKQLAGLRVALAGSEDRDALSAAWSARMKRVRAGEVGARPADGQDAADWERLRPLAALTGLEQAHFLAVAGAPSSRDMLEELTALGLPINEFYGSSETIIITTSPPERTRLGTAGTALCGVELTLADDGEILVAGPTVTPGYFRDRKRTAEAFDRDGRFLTGDIGELDQDGYLRIVDRKKALIINSAGKNMSPANIEQAIKGGVPLIAQVVAVGDRRPFNVALIVLDRDVAAGVPDVQAAIAEAVAHGNERLSRPEQIKRYRILQEDWPLGGDELTPTAKLRRREIEVKYAEMIDALYGT
jgi:long-subunit acyl-CoA synthetase (AMP-forming)